MSKDDLTVAQDINALIIKKLRSYPDAVSELAMKTIELSGTLPEATVYEALQSLVREVARRQGR